MYTEPVARIEIADETYRALTRLAEARGSDVNALVECALTSFVDFEALGDDQWQERRDAAITRIRAGIPEEITEAEVDADIDAAIAEVRTATRAGSH